MKQEYYDKTCNYITIHLSSNVQLVNSNVQNQSATFQKHFAS